jgi:hypothetical protein
VSNSKVESRPRRDTEKSAIAPQKAMGGERRPATTLLTVRLYLAQICHGLFNTQSIGDEKKRSFVAEAKSLTSNASNILR